MSWLRFSRWTLIGFYWLATVQSVDAQSPQGSETYERVVRPMLDRYCVSCHGPDKQSAALRLDTITASMTEIETASVWSEVLDRLNLGEMPPEGKPRADSETVLTVIDWITDELGAAEESSRGSGGQVVLRRLNRAEYNNTIRDLLGVDFQPANEFPEDPPAFGFDNIGSALQVSPLLLEQYLDASRTILDRAIVTGPRPVSHTWHMEVEQAHRSVKLDRRDRAGEDERWVQDHVTTRHRYLIKGGGVEVRDGFVVQKGSREEEAAGFRWFKIPEAGTYVIRVRAAAVVPNRREVVEGSKQLLLKLLERNEWNGLNATERQNARDSWLRDEWPELRDHFEDDSMYDYGAPRLKVATQDGTVIGEVSVDATPEDPQIFEFRYEFTPDPRGTTGVEVTNNYQVPRVLENFWFQGEAEFPRPELLIDWVELEGVHTDQWPPVSQTKILFESPNRSNEDLYAREVIERLMTRAYRRPVDRREVDALLDLFHQVRPSKNSFEEAIKTPLTAILVTPDFLYLIEPSVSEEPRALTDFEIASRLSYFLWSSMPDRTLFQLAQNHELRDPDVLRAQVDRMLQDPKSDAFVRNFAGQWLGLRELGANPPVENLYPRYDVHLERSMRRESEAFFAEILHHNLDVRNFLDSDFVVINQRLARFYGIPGVHGDYFRRVDVPDDLHRGGILTQASVLTLTSNGTRTSPVVRGVWVLENLLGDPPPPPPPDAGDLAPKVPGINKATVRDRLEAHRRIPECASCHRKIDPIGFALENFDAHGRWREQYGFGYNGRVGDEDPPVDASGLLPDGSRFQNLPEFQAILRADDNRFFGALVEKLLTYALGRGLSPSDQPLQSALSTKLATTDPTLRGLIKSIVVSDAFLSK